MDILTDRQEEIFNYILEHIEDEGYPPTIRRIGAHFNIVSPNGVKEHLLALQRKGYINLRPRTSRGIEVLRRPRWTEGREKGIPLVGRIAAGLPVLAVENIEDRLTLERLFPSDGRIFALRVRGDSMTDAGIYDGDIVIVRPQKTAEKGDIVVALLDDEATVKKFHRKRNKVCLIPANKKYTPIILDSVEIAGKVIGVIRKIQ
ncbi:MAG: transcriptional repressor LexA [bacterium]